MSLCLMKQGQRNHASEQEVMLAYIIHVQYSNIQSYVGVIHRQAHKLFVIFLMLYTRKREEREPRKKKREHEILSHLHFHAIFIITISSMLQLPPPTCSLFQEPVEISIILVLFYLESCFSSLLIWIYALITREFGSFSHSHCLPLSYISF